MARYGMAFVVFVLDNLFGLVSVRQVYYRVDGLNVMGIRCDFEIAKSEGACSKDVPVFERAALSKPDQCKPVLRLSGKEALDDDVCIKAMRQCQMVVCC